jgi:hypothetical protein
MIEKHYGRYVKNDVAEQLLKLISVTPTVTPQENQRVAASQPVRKSGDVSWWAHLDSNQGPTGYEPVALTN